MNSRRKTPVPSNEPARLRALFEYNILDSESEVEFDELARLAKQICKVPVSQIGFVDADRVWFKSSLGAEFAQIPRDEAFCAHAILRPDLFTVSDASKDDRFTSSAFFVSGQRLTFYAGIPLVSPEGYPVGTLCVMDYRSRSLSQEQRDGLQSLARQVMSQLNLRRSLVDLERVTRQLDLETLRNQRAEVASRVREVRLKSVLDSNLIGIAFVNLDGSINEANSTFLAMFGYTQEHVSLGKLHWTAITPTEPRLVEGKPRLELSEDLTPVETEYLHRDGSRIPVLFRATRHEGSEQEFVCFFFNLTGQKQAQLRVTNYDTLTNLPNQVLFKDRLQQVLALTRRYEQVLAVILVNLDKFKVINDTLGYQRGDQVLQEVARRLTNCVRESDTVARFGSDEFAVLLTQISCSEDAAIVAENIKLTLDLPFNFNGQDFFITSRMGISLHPSDGENSLSLLKSAATALSRAKEHASGYEFYTPGRTTMALKQLLLQNNLRAALERDEFVLHYQPQVNTETAQVIGMEALVRWQHPGLGLLYPGEFIGLAEDNGLIGLLSEWVLRNACRQNKSWQDAGFDPLRVAVNLSALQFQQPRSVETIARILDETGLNPRFLELELTEGSIMKNPEQVIEKLREFKDMGVRISIDDFGTGYSSLNYLKRFPIDTLKIDQSFVREISSNAADEAIVTAIITLAHALKLNVIAEGVETSEQFESLRKLKCNEVQGFLFSEALPTEEFTQLLSEKRHYSSPRDYKTTRLPPLPSELRRVI